MNKSVLQFTVAHIRVPKSKFQSTLHSILSEKKEKKGKKTNRVPAIPAIQYTLGHSNRNIDFGFFSICIESKRCCVNKKNCAIIKFKRKVDRNKNTLAH